MLSSFFSLTYLYIVARLRPILQDRACYIIYSIEGNLAAGPIWPLLLVAAILVIPIKSPSFFFKVRHINCVEFAIFVLPLTCKNFYNSMVSSLEIDVRGVLVQYFYNDSSE